MTQSDRELAALGRIICVIKRFHQTPNSKMGSKVAKDAYLKQHLSGQDWKFWQQLQVEVQEMPVNQTTELPEQGITQTQFKLMLAQYKRAGMESYQVWCQTQQHTDFGPSDTLSSC